MWGMEAGAVFDKTVFEQFLTKLQAHPAKFSASCQYTTTPWAIGCAPTRKSAWSTYC